MAIHDNAIHEAGHAIAAVSLGLAPTSITVSATGGGMRHAPTRDLSAVPTIAAAGLAAERLFDVRTPRAPRDRRIALTAARELARLNHRGTPIDYIAAGVYAAEVIVRANRAAIANLADRLTLAAHLSGSELATTLEETCKR